MKKLVLFLLVLGLMAGALSVAAIGENRDPDRPFWNPSEEDIASWRVIEGVEEGAVIRFWPWALSGFEAYLDQLVANFMRVYPEVTVTYEIQPPAGARDNIRNNFAAGSPADVINVSDSWVAEFAEAGVLMNMDEAFAAYPELRAQYVDGAWVKAAYEGTTYSIPWYLALSNVMAVNTLILDELGYTVDDLPRTTAEVVDFARRVREDSGGAYYAFSYALGELAGLGVLNNFYGEGVTIRDESGAAVFNTPEAVQVLSDFTTMINEDLIPRRSLTDDVREMVDRFAGGEILLLSTGPQLLRLINEANPEVYESLVLVNGITGAANIRNIGGVQMIVVPANTPFPNAALAFAQYMTSAEAQTAFTQEAAIFSSNLDSYSDPFFTEGGPALTDGLRPLARDYFLSAQPVSIGFPNQAQVEQIVLGETQAALLGVKTPAQAVADMQDRINAVISGN
jgi:putative chitobiose transport system substrate-binding protein